MINYYLGLFNCWAVPVSIIVADTDKPILNTLFDHLSTTIYFFNMHSIKYITNAEIHYFYYFDA